MGLFKKREGQAKTEVNKKPSKPVEIRTAGTLSFYFPEEDSGEGIYYSVIVNLTQRAVKVYVPHSGLPVKGGYLELSDDLIRLIDVDTVIFEITPKSKAFKELEPYANSKTEQVYFQRKESEHGQYYKAEVRFIIVPV